MTETMGYVLLATKCTSYFFEYMHFSGLVFVGIGEAEFRILPNYITSNRADTKTTDLINAFKAAVVHLDAIVAHSREGQTQTKS